MKTQAIFNILRNNKTHFFGKYPLKSMSLFGSYARIEQIRESDIDILVEFSSSFGFEFVDLAIELEQLLNQMVDLVSRKGVKADMLPYIEKDLIYV